MASAVPIEVRPRTAGEILDDAWRLYLADAPLLLALSGLGTVPCALVVLLLLTQPKPGAGWQQGMLPALAAAALLATGLSSGACQAALRGRAEGRPPMLGSCLRAALRRGGDHLAARALILLGMAAGGLFLVLPGLLVWMGGAAVGPILAAGEARLWQALGASAAETQRQPGKAAAVVLSRSIVFLLAVLNLAVLIELGLWAAGNLAGLDVALLEILLAPSNPVTLTALALLAWILLTPYFEASNYLLHIDNRARYEGLDLGCRVQRYLSAGDGRGARVVVLAMVSCLLMSIPLQAAEDHRAAIPKVRKDIQAIRKEVEAATTYPDGVRREGRLRALAEQLDGGADPARSRYRWFRKAVEGFDHRSREGALQVLADLDHRLGLIEESLETPPLQSAREIKERWARDHPDRGEAETDPRDVAPKPKPRPEVREEPEVERQPKERPEKGALPAPASAGFNLLGWMMLGGVLLLVLALAGVFFYRQWKKKQRPRPASQASGKAEPSLEAIVTQPDRFTVAGLWGQAEQLAGGGEYREAVRIQYLAVLALLHRANLIRFARTRTNGEYARQLREREALHQPFTRMTDLFEVQWYSESICQLADYRTCRELAEGIRGGINAA
jgi:hypothetical protein